MKLKIETKFDLGDEVLVDYGGGYGLISEVIDLRYSPNDGLSYAVAERPSRYFSEDRISIYTAEEGNKEM